MPSAVRKKAKTITMRVKLVITRISDGAITRSVIISTMLSVVTSSVGSEGAVRERFTLGSMGLFGIDGTDGMLDG